MLAADVRLNRKMREPTLGRLEMTAGNDPRLQDLVIQTERAAQGGS